MIVDTSSVVAIFQAEPEAADLAEALAEADRRLMSAGSYLELSMVMIDRRGVGAREHIDAFLAGSLIAVAPFDEAQAQLAREAFIRFGKGRHRASLNFGDCMTYALAKHENLPVLCKGTDFSATDIGVVPLPSPAYKLFVQAMAEQKQLLCTYEEHARELCPSLLGHNSAGEEVALVFQFAGETSKGALRKPEWKCLKLARVKNVRLRNGPWQEGGGHSQRQTCVADVDYDVNPESPYNPRRRLPVT